MDSTLTNSQGAPLMALMSFLQKDSLYEDVKPYRLGYRSDNVPTTNLVRQAVRDIEMHDLRGIEHELTFERNGVAVLEADNIMEYDDFNDRQQVIDSYCTAIGHILLEYMQAKTVQVFDYNIRRRHPKYPDVKDETSTARDQPTRNVHIDATGAAVHGIIKELNPGGATDLLDRRVVYVNVWRPLKGPVKDWPIALCDAESIVPSRDFAATDHIIRTQNANEGRLAENYSIHYHPSQRWLYLSLQQPNELLIFRQYDSNGLPGVPHGSFDVSSLYPPEPENQRESIEVRAIVYL
ncbi:hypothetical protein FSARC_7835 [Fusarium sarcochroum]|uniref:Methyltransferase n=1 Tax=Fusarium sarcochroum TaxID=1208366 RepID=A0A8H4X7U7_9HYPO|nr:hypothetical protein FSARC_7835 [Fusarium sarcochroum]